MIQALGQLIDSAAQRWVMKRSGRGLISGLSLFDRPRNVTLPVGPTRNLPVEIQAFEQIPTIDPVDLWRINLRISTVRACVSVISKAATARGVRLRSLVENPSPEEQGRIDEFLKKPNEEETIVDILKEQATHLEIFGNSYQEIVRAPTGEVIALIPLDPVTMRILADEKGRVLGYLQITPREPIIFGPEEIIHTKLESQIVVDGQRMGRSLYGLAPLASLLLVSEQDIWAQLHNKAFFKNGAKVRGVYVMGNATNDQITRNREYIAQTSEPEFAHRDIVLQGKDVEYIKIGSDPKDMEFSVLRRTLRDEILSVFGVPPSLISYIETGNIGAGTGESQQENFREETVIPLQTTMVTKLNQKLLMNAMGIKDWALELVSPEISSERTQAEIDKIYLTDNGQGAVLTPQEVRAMRFPALDSGSLQKRLKPNEIAARAGRTDQLVDIVNTMEQRLRREIRRLLGAAADRFNEESRKGLAKRISDAIGQGPFEFRHTIHVHGGMIAFQKYVWPNFMKQSPELEEALADLDPERISQILTDGLIQVGQESIKDLEFKTRSERIQFSPAIRESLIGNANEIAGHISQLVSDTVRSEVAQGVAAGESVSEISRRLRGLDELQVEVRPRGAQLASTRRRDVRDVAETIARTETRRVFTQVAKQGFRDAEIDRVRWVAAPNPDPLCAAAASGGEDGVYAIDAIPAGGPPLHHNCRCVLQPFIE